jgi:hypothetical protein
MLQLEIFTLQICRKTIDQIKDEKQSTRQLIIKKKKKKNS